MSLVELPTTTAAGLSPSKSILLLHNKHFLGQFIHSLLTDRGYEVTETECGRTALELVNRGGFDLAIVSETLEDIDGLGWIVKLRESQPNFRVVFISSTWREPELYQKLTQELRVALVVNRPLKPALFGIQIDNLFVEGGDDAETINMEESSSQDRFDYLQRRYLSVIPARLAKLEEAMGQARSNVRDIQALSNAIRLSHNMKGTASSCGLGMISKEAERLERTLTSIQTGTPNDPASLWAQATHLYVSLTERIATTVKSHEGTATGAPDAVAPEDSGKINVLLVSRELRFEWASTFDLHLSCTPSVQDALEKAKSSTYDAALIDLDWPNSEEAFALAKELRGMPGYENLPLGFVSNGDPQDRTEGTRAGGSLFVERPVSDTSIRDAAKYLTGIRQGGRPRILIVDDDADFCQMITAPLSRNGMIVRAVTDPAKMMMVMQEFAPDLVLLDIMMPGISGFEVCRNIRASSRWQDLPIIFLTAQANVDARIGAFDAGADDYLPKPVIDAELLTRVRVRLERARLIRERADKDMLTGLLSRRAFTEQMNALLAESIRHNFTFSVCFLDVDHFKQVNDSHGHAAGDEVLAKLGQFLTRRFRVEDLRGRWGGEEFVMAFPHASSAVMRGALSRILDEFSGLCFVGEHGDEFQVSFSAGMATFPTDGTTLKVLLQVADRRLYQAKESGRRTIVMHD